MDMVSELASAALIETEGSPGGPLVRSLDADRFLDAVASAGLGVIGFDVFRPGPDGFELDPGGTASFGNASGPDNNVELSRSILSAYVAESNAWIDFTLC